MADPIVFKCEDSLWRMLQDGSKRFDMRRWDVSDERIYRLAWGHWEERGPLTSPEAKGEALSRYFRELLAGRRVWVPVEKEVSFLNKATQEVLAFEYKGMEFAAWAPGWCFLLLGDPVGVEEGGEQHGAR
ncbi:MAG: hypothetical protein Q8O76_02990 [Chloroflexota bacterium]|nr:hypothetical protein [Chloroflexota bacterium]